MKIKLLWIFAIIGIQVSMAQNKYEKLWNEVEAYELEGKFKSANETVEKILKKAKRSKQSDQIVKSFIYGSKFALLLEEEAERKIIHELEGTINSSEFPTVALLESVYAGFLYQYLQQNRNSIRNRSIVDFGLDSRDYEKWDINTFIFQISNHFSRSLQNSQELKKLSIKDFASILTESKTGHRFRPTLYDFLVHRALEFYERDKWYAKRPNERFYINDPVVFESTDDFAKEPFYTSDSVLSNRNVLKLYQKVESFHQGVDTLAYIDVVLSRLQFCRKQADIENKNDLYLKALKSLTVDYQHHEASAFIDYQIANFYFESSQIYNAKNDSELKEHRIKALAICNRAIEKFPNSDGGLLCTILKNKINEPSIYIRTEDYVIPGKPFLAEVTYSNIDSLYMSVYKIPFNQFEDHYSYQRDSIALEIVKENKPIISRFYRLKSKKNFYEYSTEIDLPELPKGHYLIVATSTREVQSVDEVYSHSVVTSSNLSMLSIDKGKGMVFKLLDRCNGNHIRGVTLSVSSLNGFNRKGRTDSQGEFFLKKGKNYHDDLQLMATFQGDTLINQDYYVPRFYGDDEFDDERIAKMFLYLDRSIYRPGQTMHFKGLLVENSKGKSRAVPNIYVSVFIYDANGEELKEFRLKTNDFGSISGEFKIPDNVLTGEFSIEMDEDYGSDEEDEDLYYEKIDDLDYVEVYFSVEEYKRPKFEVTFDAISEDYKLGDSIQVRGLAKAFLGSSISDAKVAYSITRQLQPNWINGFNVGAPQLLKTGKANTSDGGVFEIDFMAEIDPLVNRTTNPVFLFTILVDVTDSNGETRSGTQTIKIGIQNIRLDLDVSTSWNGSKPHEISYEATNLNENSISAEVELSIYKLETPNRVFREKPWPVVEIPFLSKEKYVELFPNEVYDDTDLKENWKRGEKVFYEKRKITGPSVTIVDEIGDWPTGSYVLEAKAIDVFNDSTFAQKEFEVFQPEDQRLTDNKLFTYRISNVTYKADGFVEIQLRTSCDTLNVNVEAFYRGRSIFKRNVIVQNGSSYLKVPVKQSYKDKLDFNVYFVKYNSHQSKNFSIWFPELDNELEIETLSFRNYLTPDQKESWSFKITNSDNENADAEVLASMYDTSLDQFKEHSWRTEIGFNSVGYSYAPRIQSLDFFSTSSFDQFASTYNGLVFSSIRNYHNLRWFGFDFGGLNYKNKTYLSSLATKKENQSSVVGNISGIITDVNGMPLPGAYVVLNGTSNVTQTDFDGFYSINAPKGSELNISFIGFKSISLSITKSGTYNVVLEEDGASLDEVVVTSLGIERDKKSLGYSMSYISAEEVTSDIVSKLEGRVAGVNITNSGGGPGAGNRIVIRGNSSITGNSQTLFIIDGVPMEAGGAKLSANDIKDITVLKGESATALYGARARNGVVIITTKTGLESLSQVEVRSDLKETAFFFPHLRTDKNGVVTIDFNSPQALTEWKFMLLAHNKSVEHGAIAKSAVTQKEINVIPNPPRFLREKDTILLSAKINNLTEEKRSGTAMLQLFNGITMEPVQNSIVGLGSNQTFSIPSKGGTSVTWKINVPEGIPVLEYKIFAKSGVYTDGEANVLPVLSKRILVTEARPLWIPKGATKRIEFEKLKMPASASLKNHSFSIEYTSNPAWLAVKSLPYLIEFPYDCSEQTFSKFFSNALAEDIIRKNPQIESVFKSWQKNDNLDSSMERNSSLESLIASESPWFQDLKTDQESKARLAALFDSKKVQEGQLQTAAKLKQLQMSSGGFPWFSGGRENVTITRHIVVGIGHLKHLDVQSEHDYKLEPLLEKALEFLDKEFINGHRSRNKYQKDSSMVSIDEGNVHYMYARSFFLDSHPLSDELKGIFNLYVESCKSSWLTQSLNTKGMIALVLERNGHKNEAQDIIRALEEQTVRSEENGWYWKENISGWHWFESPIETQALLIEGFTEILENEDITSNLKQWLLRHKQTNNWSTTKATTYAIYALLMHGNNWLTLEDNTIITVGEERIKTKKLESVEKEAGTGYMKMNWKPNEINSKMGSVEIQNKGDVVGSGGVYWQYFEDLDQVSSSNETPLSVRKSLYVKKVNHDGEKLIPITEDTPIHLGDLITVRLEISSNNDLDFIHLKDMRASGFEPIDVLSEYKWREGVGYYQSTKDIATHFFFDKLPKGTYFFEYDLRANNKGSFTGGIATAQSMYAPEFSSNSKSMSIIIE